MNKENKNTNKRTFKEVVYDNRYKIITITSLVTMTALGLTIYKKGISTNKVSVTNKNFETVHSDLLVLTHINKDLMDRADVTESIINNSGIIEQAKATVTRKRDTLIGNLNRLLDSQGDGSKDIKISELKLGIQNYDKALEDYEELKYMYKACNIGETLLDN